MPTEKPLAQLCEELEEAKRAVMVLLNQGDCLVGMHDIEYWGGVVARLRKEIKERL